MLSPDFDIGEHERTPLNRGGDLGDCWDVASGKDVSADDLLVHDEHDQNLAAILANFTENDLLPTPLGVMYSEEQPKYETLMTEQIEAAKEKLGEGDLQQLIAGTDTWEVV